MTCRLMFVTNFISSFPFIKSNSERNMFYIFVYLMFLQSTHILNGQGPQNASIHRIIRIIAFAEQAFNVIVIKDNKLIVNFSERAMFCLPISMSHKMIQVFQRKCQFMSMLSRFAVTMKCCNRFDALSMEFCLCCCCGGVLFK